MNIYDTDTIILPKVHRRYYRRYRIDQNQSDEKIEKEIMNLRNNLYISINLPVIFSYAKKNKFIVP